MESRLAAALAAVILPFSLGAQEPAQRLTFDVASFRVAGDQRFLSTRPELSPGRFTWTTQLWYLLAYAFHMEGNRISGASGAIPGWSDIYDVAASLNPDATEDQMRLMVRSLLEERLKMAWRFETKTVDGWALSVAKNGPKIREFQDGGRRPPMPDWTKDSDPAASDGRIWGLLREPYVVSLTGRRISMAQLCAYLERELGTALWDETGLKGNYYIAFRYAAGDAPTDMDVDAPPLSAALRETLGLQIEKRKGPARYVVIDHIEKIPAEN